MPAPTDLRGLWVPIVTPFDDRDEVDVAALRTLAGHLLDEGASGLVALGTTGEPATLTGDERVLVATTCAEVCRARGRQVMVGAAPQAALASVNRPSPAANTPRRLRASPRRPAGTSTIPKARA